MIGINTITRERAKRSAAALFILAFFIFLTGNPSLTGDSVRRALDVCASAVIPSLYPFMVLSSLMVASGAASMLGEALARPASAIFGLGGACAPAILLGALSGFPAGAKCALSLYRASLCSKEEAERLLSFCNNAGPSFVIAGIGISVLGDLRAGVALYAIEMISAFIVAQLMRPRAGKKPRSAGTAAPGQSASLSPAALVSAVADSAATMLNVCAFVIFFAVICDALTSICAAAGLPPAIPAALNSLLEVTSGERSAALLGAPGFILGGAALGWSGISVHLQVLSILKGSGLSCRRYFAGKLMQSLLCALLCAAYMLLLRS